MKTKQLRNLKDKTINELKEVVKKTQAELGKLRTEAVTKKLKNTSVLRQKRQDIAQIKTLIREKELKIA